MTQTTAQTGPAAYDEVDDYPELALYIDGAWTQGSGGRTEPVTDPATGRVLGHVPLAEPADLDRALAAAERGFRIWRETPVEQRSAILRRAAGLIRAQAGRIGRVMTAEEGKVLAESVGEAQRAAFHLEYNAEEAKRAHGRIVPTGPGETLSVLRVPVGPVAAFVPWNFPAGGPMRKISAALAAGCSIVIKPSEETPGTSVLMVRAFEEAGLPPGVLNLVFGVPAEVSAHLIPSPVVQHVAFTGSIPVGKLLGGLSAAHMKPTTMELGGHAPVLVCQDADPVAAAKASARGKYANSGQVCTSPSRFFVHEDLYDRFVEAFVAASEAVRVGNGLEPGVGMGPMANARRREAVHALVLDAVERGARVLTGGEIPEGAGLFYPPTVLVDVPEDARVLHEEPFGPVAPILRFTDLDEALERANALPYGLAAYGFTDRAATADRLVRGLEAGILSINHTGGSVPQAPSGGFKESGHGREGGAEGLEGYLATKRVSHRMAA